LRKAFEAAIYCLERQRDAINALNVFPVPDGDTGTNMLLTMRSVNEEAARSSDFSAGAVAAAMAHGALLGARGNSGVILSQFFHGLAQGLRGKDNLTGEDLAQAFQLASRAAFSSVSKPVDGTMLTVIRELSLAASRHIGSRGGYRDVLSVWRTALEAAKEALSRTPLQLPALWEAGVVDAGGQGIVTLLEGAWRYLAGEDLDAELEICVPLSSGGAIDGTWSQLKVQEEYLAATEDALYGYCTQFLIHRTEQGQGLDVDKAREQLSSMAESTVVVGNESLVKVHVHAHDPGPVISYAVSLGIISQVSITDMDRQHQEFVALHRSLPSSPALPPHRRFVSQAAGPHSDDSTIESVRGDWGREREERHGVPRDTSLAVVAVTWGEGFIRLFKGLGCAAIVVGGQTMNPSTQELLNAARDTGAGDVILLPNNSNIIPAARQAAAISLTPTLGPHPQPLSQWERGVRGEVGGRREWDEGRDECSPIKLHIIPSQTLPQGVAALLAFNPEGTLETNLESMEKALAAVKTIEVTRAVRSTTLGGMAMKEGQYIGLLEGELVATGDSALSALQQTLMKGEPVRGQLVTLYWGGDIQEDQAREAAAQLRESNPGVDVEVVPGGQPFYQYIASLE